MPKPPETLGQKAARLQAEVDALTTRLENMAGLQEQLDKANAEVATLRNGQNSSGAAEAQWRNRAQDAEARATQLSERNAESARDKVTEQVQALQNGLDMATRAANQSGQRLVDTSNALAEKDRQLGEVRRELAQLRATSAQVVEDLRHQVASFDDQLKGKDQQIVRLQQAVTDLGHVTESWKQRAQQAEGSIADKDQRLAVLDRTIVAQRQRLGDVQEHVTRTYELLQRSL